MRRYLFIALGGSLGAILRYVVGVTVTRHFGAYLHLGTLLINITACFLIGLVVPYLNRRPGLNEAWRYLIPIGFLGAYSTFSTFEYEAWTDLSHGIPWSGVLYVSISLLAGFAAVVLGATVARARS